MGRNRLNWRCVGVLVLISLFLVLFYTAHPLPPAVDPNNATADLKLLDRKIQKLEKALVAKYRASLTALSTQQHLGPSPQEARDDGPVVAPKPRADGRVELSPRNTGCYVATTRKACCQSIDSRYSIHGPIFYGGSPCVAPVGKKFTSGGKCEPELWVKENDPGNLGGCDKLEEETLEEIKAKGELKKSREHEAALDLNLMWVTDCQLSLEWSSALLLWSALHVKQPGDFTRIATGCETAKARKFVTDAMNTVSDIFDARDRVKVHFAPKHDTDARDGTDGEVYSPYTKAFGVKHFLDNNQPRNRVGVILDPDFVFNRPLEYRMDTMTAEQVILGDYTEDWRHDVRPGKPVGQQYGLGDGWLNYNLKEICGEDSPCTKVSNDDAWRYFTMGPPIFMTISDWRKVAQQWYDFLPIIRRKNKDWMEEMRSYTMSSAHNQQKTIIFSHYMISDKGSNPKDEGWPWIERNPALPDICHDGKALNVVNYPEIDPEQDPYPPILHYCAAYEPEYYDKHYFWSKYQINFGIAQQGNLLDCNVPLYEDPPKDLLRAQNFERQECISQRRQAWMLCQIQYILNDFLVSFKEKKCAGKYNKNRVAKHEFDPRPSKEDHPDECRKKRPD